MRNKVEQSYIRALVESPTWRVVEDIAKEFIQRIKDNSNLAETDWETLKNVAIEEGQIRGINTLIQELYKIASEND